MSVIRLLEEDGFGRLIEFIVFRVCGNCKVFIKFKLNLWLFIIVVSDIEFDNVFNKGIYSDILVFMRVYL